jgi:glycosyltransferase involved in cell wall biosynthesis
MLRSAPPINVVHIISDLSVGGAEMMLFNLLSRADARRFKPAVISLGKRSKLDARIEDLNIPVYNLGMRPATIPSPAQVWRLLAVMRRLKADLIQGWMYHGSLAAHLSRFTVARRTPVIWSIHSCNNDLTLEKRLTSAVIRMCARLSSRPEKILYVSQASRRQHEAMGYCAEKSHVITNGFDTAQFSPSVEARAALRAELGLRADQFLIGLVGRFHPMKDHLNFLRAAALMSSDNGAPQFVLAGREVDGDNHALGRLLAKSGLEGRVHLLGERGDTHTLIAALDVCSLSSSYGESFPLVVGEAMACGVPCVVTDLGDAAMLVGDTGLVVPPRNPEALARAWRELIRLGPDGRAQLGEAARERVCENFMLASVVAQYESLWKKIAAENGSLNGCRSKGDG